MVAFISGVAVRFLVNFRRRLGFPSLFDALRKKTR
ncbi:hypothetical protein COLO4_15177 [Corchorus olitorius]|uniref:Uncharacterized protein n=1 Tax=Corchorus olitorius TaxID=93759 RepID=A0A1R3JP15_9ROSI|nr:hypothetical protein COLO4_15177 [Corchorus olitorius]